MDVPTAIMVALERFLYDGEYGVWFWPAIFLIFSALCVMWFMRSLLNKRKRNWDVSYFLPLIGVLFLWSVCVFQESTGQLPVAGPVVTALEMAARVFLPCLVHLHIWKQVSHKELTPLRLVLNFMLPAAVLAFTIFQVQTAGGLGNQFIMPGIAWIIFMGYSVVTYIRCFTLCFSVFYQMPKHMRKSSYTMIVGLIILTAASLFPIWENGLAPYNIPMLATGIAVHFLFEAQYANTAANVIATSRDFVFNNLSTMVMVLSKEQRILDWNREHGSFLELLPEPHYREKFGNYRRRVIVEGDGNVSEHIDNIILLNYNGLQCQFLVKLNEISNKTRVFGYVAEISEITPVYSVLRAFEGIATVDHLTGLLNRNAYLADVQKFIDEGTVPLCIAVGDVNNLKQINDAHSHLIGDKLLTTIAGIMKDKLPARAKAYRIGGDEFVLLIPGGSPSQVEAFTAEVKAGCGLVNDVDFGTPSISWGCAVRNSPEEDYNDVFTMADKMMYAKKKAHHQFTSSGMVPLARKIYRPRTKMPEIVQAPSGGPAAGQPSRPARAGRSMPPTPPAPVVPSAPPTPPAQAAPSTPPGQTAPPAQHAPSPPATHQ